MDITDAILKDGKLIANGEEGINGLTISNAMHLSSWINESVDVKNLDEDLFYDMLDKAEQEKIDAEIAAYEEKENQNIQKSKVEKIKEQLEKDNVLEEIKTFEGEVEEKPKKKKTPPKKAKVTVKTNKNKSNNKKK